jgi:hypothetical protein
MTDFNTSGATTEMDAKNLFASLLFSIGLSFAQQKPQTVFIVKEKDLYPRVHCF